jgi:hypothetical protein
MIKFFICVLVGILLFVNPSFGTCTYQTTGVGYSVSWENYAISGDGNSHVLVSAPTGRKAASKILVSSIVVSVDASSTVTFTTGTNTLLVLSFDAAGTKPLIFGRFTPICNTTGALNVQQTSGSADVFITVGYEVIP